MKGDIKAPRTPKFADTRERVGKLTLTAQGETDEKILAALALAIFPIGERDDEFDLWKLKKLGYSEDEIKAAQDRRKNASTVPIGAGDEDESELD